MIQHTSRLREKDVINICTGRRIGFICDFLIDTDCGKITAVLVSEHFFALSGAKNTICIPWERITCIGEDSVLVKIDDECLRESGKEDNMESNREKRKRGGWFF